jgi:hypothetical protein
MKTVRGTEASMKGNPCRGAAWGRTLLAVCTVILSASLAFAGSPKMAKDLEARPTDESEAGQLIALEKMWNQVQLLRDSKALDNLIGERFVGTYSGGQFGRKAEFLADIQDAQNKPTAASIQDLNVELYGDTAIVTGIYHTHGTDHGKPYDVLGRFTDTWIHQRSKWECVASHASLLKGRK